MVAAWKSPIFGGSLFKPIQAKKFWDLHYFSKESMIEMNESQTYLQFGNSMFDEIIKSTDATYLTLRKVKFSKRILVDIFILITDKSVINSDKFRKIVEWDFKSRCSRRY